MASKKHGAKWQRRRDEKQLRVRREQRTWGPQAEEWEREGRARLEQQREVDTEQQP